MLICIAGMILLCGCEAKTRYQVLSFFFDGVPAPQDQSSRGNTTAGKAASASDATAGGQTRRGSQHGPYAARMCKACHDANTNALVLPKSELCLNCHTLPPARRSHGPVVSGGCTVCHDPHLSSYEYLLISPAREFCSYCHDPKEVSARDAHRGITASCTECHNPHGSDNEYFLR